LKTHFSIQYSNITYVQLGIRVQFYIFKNMNVTKLLIVKRLINAILLLLLLEFLL